MLYCVLTKIPSVHFFGKHIWYQSGLLTICSGHLVFRGKIKKHAMRVPPHPPNFLPSFNTPVWSVALWELCIMSKNTTQWANKGSNLKFSTSSPASLPLSHCITKSLVQLNILQLFTKELSGTYPLVSLNLAPALVRYLRCKFDKSLSAVSGLSLGEPLAFFRGENSSSLATSRRASFL